MSIEQTPGLEDVWGEVAPRLRRMLRRRGVGRDDVDDLLQETATRAIQRGVRFADAEDLLRWCNTVAWRAELNRRRNGRRETVGVVQDGPSTDRVDDRALDRYTLAVVSDRVGQLTPIERAALGGAPAGPAPTRVEAVRWHVRRHRARARLIAMLDGLAAILGWLVTRARNGRTRAAVALAIPMVAIAALTIPHLGPTRGPSTLTTDPTMAPSTSPALVRSGRSLAGPIAVPTTSTTVHRRMALPPFEVPLARGVLLGGEAKEPDDHLLCVNTVLFGVQCVDEPPAVKELFGPTP